MTTIAIIITILLVIFIFCLFKLRNKTISELNKVLIIDNNPKLYLDLLNNKRLNLLFNKSALDCFRLKGYLMLNDEKNIIKYFDLLDSSKVAKGDKVEYNALKLSYFAKKGNKQKSKEALDEITKLTEKSRIPQTLKLLEDAQIIYRVYIEKDRKLIDELSKELDNQEGLQKAITLFRIAKLYYFNNNATKAKEKLNEAKPLAKNSTYELIINECLNDIANLNKY